MVLGEVTNLAESFNQWWHSRSEWSGVTVVDEDWDVLIILDACRYDTFREFNPFPGELSAVQSAGSNSIEFMRHNFCGRRLHDTVYITANPHSHMIPEDTFHAIDPVYVRHWNESVGVVTAETMTAAAQTALEEYPRKRLIIHYMQPHAPYLGEYGRMTIEHNIAHDPTEEVRAVWTNIRYGFTNVTINQVHRAYRENLQLVLDSIAGIISECDEKIVVTSDHGELLGERQRPIPVRGYGHPPDIRLEPLVTVPWLELPYESRRNVVSEPPEQQSLDHDVDEKLAALGYK